MVDQQQHPVKDFAKDMKREVHVTPTVRNVIIVSMAFAVLVLGTCMLVGAPTLSPTHPYDPVQRRAGTLFGVSHPDQAVPAHTTREHSGAAPPGPIAPIAPADLSPSSSSGQSPQTVYTPPSAQ